MRLSKYHHIDYQPIWIMIKNVQIYLVFFSSLFMIVCINSDFRKSTDRSMTVWLDQYSNKTLPSQSTTAQDRFIYWQSLCQKRNKFFQTPFLKKKKIVGILSFLKRRRKKNSKQGVIFVVTYAWKSVQNRYFPIHFTQDWIYFLKLM